MAVTKIHQRPFREPTIVLTEGEQELFVRSLNVAQRHDHHAEIERGDAACALMNSLLKRDAIPKERKDYFWNPDFNIGGHGRSRAEIFTANGNNTAETFRHIHFAKYLMYFLCGPNLPPPVIRQFRQAVDDCGGVTSGDLEPLSSLAKQLTRQHQLEPSEAAEEFHKLAIECGLSADFYARFVRDAVKKIR